MNPLDKWREMLYNIYMVSQRGKRKNPDVCRRRGEVLKTGSLGGALSSSLYVYHYTPARFLCQEGFSVLPKFSMRNRGGGISGRVFSGKHVTQGRLPFFVCQIHEGSKSE